MSSVFAISFCGLVTRFPQSEYAFYFLYTVIALASLTFDTRWRNTGFFLLIFGVYTQVSCLLTWYDVTWE